MKNLLVIMGVSGVGKTTVGEKLARELKLPFYDADDFHPPANVAKMSAGVPLDDRDRDPWLKRLNELLREQHGGAVLACSALKLAYRDEITRDLAGRVQFVFLDAPADFLAERIGHRTDHFMPASLLQSQFATLETPQSAWEIDARQSVEAIVDEIVGLWRKRIGS